MKDRRIFWGLGIEHEMQIFHQGKDVNNKKNFDNANIIFDSQEATCLITDDLDAQGACRKKISPDINMLEIKKMIPKSSILGNKNKLTKNEKEFLESIDWELTGRNAKNCKNGSVIIKRTPVLMPELVTSNFKNRSINSIVEESIKQEETFLNCMMKNMLVREKVKQYGTLTTHLCGSLDDIKVPIRPTILDKKYKFETVKYKDYVGSYHVTITLPHLENIETVKFIKMHHDLANQIQWVEPLLLTSFFSPDGSSVGKGPDKGIQGSFRIMVAGWGNMAGSNIRKFGTEGIGRGTDIKNYWRKDLKLKGTKKINECVKTSPPQYKKAISILTSDFRTFNLEKNMKKCRKLYNPSDCPRIDGGKMEPPFGMEIRIFDHFPSEYLIDLMKIIILLAANSDRHPASTYVYKNPIWIKAIQDIMAYGWNTVLQYSYVVLLRKELGLDLKLKNNDLMAFNLFKTMVDELYAKNKNHRLIYIMDETPHIKPRIPEINRLCWELSFNKKFLKKIINDIKENREKLNITKTNLTLFEFKKLVNGSNSIWRHQMTDLLFALQSKHKVNLKLNNARIEKIKLLF